METCYEDSIFDEDNESEYDSYSLGDSNQNSHDESVMLFYGILLMLKEKYSDFTKELSQNNDPTKIDYYQNEYTLLLSEYESLIKDIQEQDKLLENNLWSLPLIQSLVVNIGEIACSITSELETQKLKFQLASQNIVTTATPSNVQSGKKLNTGSLSTYLKNQTHDIVGKNFETNRILISEGYNQEVNLYKRNEWFKLLEQNANLVAQQWSDVDESIFDKIDSKPMNQYAFEDTTFSYDTKVISAIEKKYNMYEQAIWNKEDMLPIGWNNINQIKYIHGHYPSKIINDTLEDYHKNLDDCFSIVVFYIHNNLIEDKSSEITQIIRSIKNNFSAWTFKMGIDSENISVMKRINSISEVLPINKKNMEQLDNLNEKINQLYNLLDIGQDIDILSKDIINEHIDKTICELLSIENTLELLSREVIHSTINDLRTKIYYLRLHIQTLQNQMI